jgi:Flp pilus assembly protein TadG
VEFAISLPVFMMLVLGMFTGGLALHHKIVVTNSAREGARYGATLAQAQCPCGGLSWTAAVQSVAVQRSGGNIQTVDVCVALVQGAGSSVAAIDAGHTSAGGTSACFVDNSSDSGKRVQVSVRRQDTIEWLVGAKTVTLLAQATAKYEQ